MIYYRRFGTTYSFHPRGSRGYIHTDVSGQPIGPILRGRESKEDHFWIGCPETSVINHHYSLRNNPEERSSQLLHGGSLKSHIVSQLVRFQLCQPDSRGFLIGFVEYLTGLIQNVRTSYPPIPEQLFIYDSFPTHFKPA